MANIIQSGGNGVAPAPRLQPDRPWIGVVQKQLCNPHRAFGPLLVLTDSVDVANFPAAS